MPRGYKSGGTKIVPPARRLQNENTPGGIATLPAKPDGLAFLKGNNQRATATLLAQARSATPEGTTEEYADDDTQAASSSVRVARSGFGRLPVYKLTPSGVTRIQVNVQSINEVLSHPSYSAACQDCGRDDCRSDIDINACSGRPPKKFRICPVTSCKKRIYDPKPTGKFLIDEFDHSGRDDGGDPNVISSADDYTSTPETRTKSAMDLHIIGFHPATASEMGIGRPAELPRMVVN